MIFLNVNSVEVSHRYIFRNSATKKQYQYLLNSLFKDSLC